MANTQFAIATHIIAALGYAADKKVNSAEIASSVNTSRRTTAVLWEAPNW